MTSDTFNKKLAALALEVKNVLKWMIKVDIPATRSTDNIMTKKADTRYKPVQKLSFARSPDPVLKKTGTEQEQQILRASLSIETYGHKDKRLRQRQLAFQTFSRRALPTHVRQCWSKITVDTKFDLEEIE